MPAVRVALVELQRAAATRPAGYLADVLAGGTLAGDYVEMEEAAWMALAARYRGADMAGIGPTPEQARQALLGADLIRWTDAGQPISAATHVARRPVCDRCPDTVCAACWRTAIYRWLPTQPCPLGLWNSPPFMAS